MLSKETLEMLQDERVKKRIQNIATMLKLKFVKIIEDKFHNDTLKFKNWLKQFGIYAKNAKNRSLSKEEAKNFAIMRKNFNLWFGVKRDELRKLNTQFRYKGKITRISSELLDFSLRNYFNLKVLNAGKNINTNEHWTKKYIPESRFFESVFNKHHHTEKPAVAKEEELTVENKTSNECTEEIFENCELSDAELSNAEMADLVKDVDI